MGSPGAHFGSKLGSTKGLKDIHVKNEMHSCQSESESNGWRIRDRVK